MRKWDGIGIADLERNTTYHPPFAVWAESTVGRHLLRVSKTDFSRQKADSRFDSVTRVSELVQAKSKSVFFARDHWIIQRRTKFFAFDSKTDLDGGPDPTG